jgi:hypothetical protein
MFNIFLIKKEQPLKNLNTLYWTELPCLVKHGSCKIKNNYDKVLIEYWFIDGKCMCCNKEDTFFTHVNKLCYKKWTIPSVPEISN